MDVFGTPVLFHLSAEGKRALKGLIPKKGSFVAFVVQMDPVGAWVDFGMKHEAAGGEGVPVMLLKWDYVAVAEFEFQPETQATCARPGFIQE